MGKRAPRLRPAVRSEYQDSDGYWINLAPGWQCGDDPGCHGIVEGTRSAATRRLASVVPCACAECAAALVPVATPPGVLHLADSTPGPWKWAGDDLEAPHETVLDRRVECGSYCQGGTARLDISPADRRLIAAAPALADVLEAIEWTQTPEGTWCPSCRFGIAIGHVDCALHAALVAAGRRG